MLKLSLEYTFEQLVAITESIIRRVPEEPLSTGNGIEKVAIPFPGVLQGNTGGKRIQGNLTSLSGKLEVGGIEKDPLISHDPLEVERAGSLRGGGNRHTEIDEAFRNAVSAVEGTVLHVVQFYTCC